MNTSDFTDEFPFENTTVVRDSQVRVRDLAEVAQELQQSATGLNDMIARFEKSHFITQELLEIEFTV
ncbi:MAG TPA: hypothetical protein VI306_09925 [Pyrinomonadaceae bacterium]